MKAEEKNKAVKIQPKEQNEDCQEIVKEFMIRKENNKKMVREIKNSTVCLGTIVGSMLAGAAIGEYEVLVHGAGSTVPAFIGACGALGGAIASGIYMAVEREEAKIDERKIQTKKEDKSMKL